MTCNPDTHVQTSTLAAWCLALAFSLFSATAGIIFFETRRLPRAVLLGGLSGEERGDGAIIEVSVVARVLDAHVALEVLRVEGVAGDALDDTEQG